MLRNKECSLPPFPLSPCVQAAGLNLPFILGVLALTGVGVIVAASCWGYGEKQPNPPDGVRCYDKTQRVTVSPGDNDGWTEPGYQVTQFVKLRSGEVVAPILRVVRPNFRGFMGGVRHDPIWEATFHFLGKGQAELILPLEEEIEQHLALVRRVSTGAHPGQDSWRLWAFNSADINRGLVMPRFETMELFSTRNDATALLQKDLTARAFAAELNR